VLSLVLAVSNGAKILIELNPLTNPAKNSKESFDKLTSNLPYYV
jgi:hypothetical protein